jgi:hypothetical protein
MKDEEPLDDPVLEEIWAIRDRIGARFGNDIHKLGEYYMDFQKQFGDRLIPAPEEQTPASAVRKKPAA